MRVNIHFATPELPCPSLWFFLGLCYRFFGGFSEALNLPESIKCYLLVPFMPLRRLLQHNRAAAFSARSRGWLGLFFTQLEKGQGTACQHTWYGSADLQRVNTHSFACFDYHQNERDGVVVSLLSSQD